MTPKGKIVLTVILVAFVSLIIWRGWDKFAPKKQEKQVDMAAVQEAMKVQAEEAAKKAVAESDAQKQANVEGKLLAGSAQANLVDSSQIPPITGASDYERSEKNGKFVLKQAINVWPGWAPFIVANKGLAPNDDSLFYKKYGFYVELVVVDDPVKARDLFASGHLHATWGTLDMFALFAPELAKDSRTSPVIVQQFDFSSGGDGVVARNGVKTINDLRMQNGRRRKVVLAQNSPSHYFITSLLIDANINPSEVDFRWADSAPSAAKIFVQDKSFDAFVGWAPDIYTIAEGLADVRLIVTTKSANQMIADVYAFRNDFFRDSPEIVENYVRGIFAGIDMVRADPNEAAQLLATAFSLPLEDCKAMIGSDGGINTGDAHLTNYRENYKFFLDALYPANFETIWKRASLIYQQLGAITAPLPASKVKASTVLAKMAKEYKDIRDLSQPAFLPGMASRSLEATDREILTKNIRIAFPPNESRLDANYDPTIEKSLEEIGNLSGGFGYAIIAIEGNTDASKKGLVNEDDVRRLSYDRADSVRRALLEKFPSLDANRFAVRGNGWSVPIYWQESLWVYTNGMPSEVASRSDSDVRQWILNKSARRVDVRILMPEETE